MRKSTRIVKRLLALFLVVLMSIESFGAVVSDNDGSAFITKAEFDSLKNSFQSQIDQYNTSIDSKIDGAIAAYLAGIKVDKKTKLSSIYNSYGGSKIQWYKSRDLWDGNTSRPRAYLASFFMCWPIQMYWNTFKSAYYRFAVDKTIRAADGDRGGEIKTRRVDNAEKMLPVANDRKAVLRFAVADGVNKLQNYFEYAILYVAWGFYFGNAGDSPTVTVSFANAQTAKENFGEMVFTDTYREASGFRIDESIFNNRDLSYAVCTNQMQNQQIMIDDTEFQKRSEVLLESWTTNMAGSDWYRNPSPNSVSTREFTTATYKTLCDYKFYQTSNGDWFTKPWEVLTYGHAMPDYPVKLYEGIPICEAQSDGEITIDSIAPSNIGELSAGNFYFSIASSPFSNCNISDESNIHSLVELKDTTETVSEADNTRVYEKVVNGDTFYYRLNKSGAKIVFESKKNTTYYIKFYYGGTTYQWDYFTVTLGNIIEES